MDTTQVYWQQTTNIYASVKEEKFILFYMFEINYCKQKWCMSCNVISVSTKDILNSQK